MTRVRMPCLCLIAACLVAVVASSQAAASEPLEPEGAPEFGRCVKASGLGGLGFTDAACTKQTLSGAKYEWLPGGPGMTFTVLQRNKQGSLLTKCKHAQHLEEEAAEKEGEATEKLKEAEGYWEKYRIALSKGELTLAQIYKEDAERCEREAGELKAEAAKLLKTAEKTRGTHSKAECEKVIAENSEIEEPVVLEPKGIPQYAIECGELTGSGAYGSRPKFVESVSLKFGGCEAVEPTALGLEEGNGACQSGATAGVIEPVAMEGELGWIKQEGSLNKDKVGVALWAKGGNRTSEVASFTCGSGEHKITITVTGSVIHEVKIDKMISKETEKVIERKGEQVPEGFSTETKEEIEEHNLHAHLGAFSIQAGMGLLSKLTNTDEEKIEVSAAV